jgi:repressor LexA
MKDLTRSEKRVYDYLIEYINENGYSPSVRDIATALGFASSSTVHLYLSRLEEKGFIEREQKKSRSFRPTTNIGGIPLLGRVHAGLPVEVDGLADEYIDVGSSLPYSKNELFALTVVGDSMIDAGIFDGDVVVVLKTADVKNGDIAVAMVDGEVTVKTFYNENGHIRLQPENSAFAPIIVDSVEILGKVVTLIRRFE